MAEPDPGLDGLDTRLTAKFSARQMRRLVDKAMAPIPRRESPFATWMRRLTLAVALSAAVVAGAILGAAWVLR